MPGVNLYTIPANSDCDKASDRFDPLRMILLPIQGATLRLIVGSGSASRAIVHALRDGVPALARASVCTPLDNQRLIHCATA